MRPNSQRLNFNIKNEFSFFVDINKVKFNDVHELAGRIKSVIASMQITSSDFKSQITSTFEDVNTIKRLNQGYERENKFKVHQSTYQVQVDERSKSPSIFDEEVDVKIKSEDIVENPFSDQE